MKKYLLPVFLAFSVFTQSEETPCRIPSTPVTISSTSFINFYSATLQPFTYSQKLSGTQISPATLPLTYVGLTSDGSVKMGFTNNLSTAASFEQTLSMDPSDSISIGTLANVSTNQDGSNNHVAAAAWRDINSKKIKCQAIALTEGTVALGPSLSLEDSNDVQVNSIKLCSIQGTSGPGYVLLWTELSPTNTISLKYSLLFSTTSAVTSSVNTAITFASPSINYVTAEDCDGGLHVLAYNPQGGIYYMSKSATSDVMSTPIKLLSKIKPSCIQSASLAASKEGFVSIVVSCKNNATGGSTLVTLHKYPSQAEPVEQDRQPIAALLEGKTIKHTIDPESNETTTVFIANKDSGKAAIHLYTRKTITIAPKDEMVSLPLNTNPDFADVDVLISHVDGTREDIVGVTSGSPIPASISMRTVKYDFFSKFRQILPKENTSSTTHLSLEPVLGGVVISYLDGTGALAVSTISVPIDQSALIH